MVERHPKVPNEVKEAVRERQGGKCACCGVEMGHALQAHHIVPRFIATHRYNMPSWLYNSSLNLVALCGEQVRANDCHEFYDQQAFREGRTFDGETLDQAATGLYNLAVMNMYIHYRYLTK